MKRGKYEEMARDAEKKGTSAEVTVSFLKLDVKGQMIVGQLLGLQRATGKESGGTYLLYLIDTDKGMVKTSFGNAYDKEMGPVLHIGDVYSWEYLGKKDISNGHRVNEIRTVLLDQSEEGELLLNYIDKNFGAGE